MLKLIRVQDDGKGRPRNVPSSTKTYCAGTDGGVALWVVEADADPITAAAPRWRQKERNDLDPKHPLYGKRALQNVPAGYPDMLDHDTLGIVQVGPDGTVLTDGKVEAGDVEDIR
jgi:hypothetical protein